MVTAACRGPRRRCRSRAAGYFLQFDLPVLRPQVVRARFTAQPLGHVLQSEVLALVEQVLPCLSDVRPSRTQTCPHEMQNVREVFAVAIEEEPALFICGVVHAAIEVGEKVPALLQRVPRGIEGLAADIEAHYGSPFGGRSLFPLALHA